MEDNKFNFNHSEETLKKVKALDSFCHKQIKCSDCYLFKKNNGGLCYMTRSKELIDKNYDYLKELNENE